MLFILSLVVIILSCDKENNDPELTPGDLSISYVFIGDVELKTTGSNDDIVLNEPLEIRFNNAVNSVSATENIVVLDEENNELESEFTFFSENKLVKIDHQDFNENSTYKIQIGADLKGANNETFKGATYSFTTLIPPLVLELILMDGEVVDPVMRIKDVGMEPQIDLHFNSSVSAADVFNSSSFISNGAPVSYNINQVDDKTLSCLVLEPLEGYAKNQFSISSGIENQIGKPFEGLELDFYTKADTTRKFPLISDDDLLTLVQRQTFKYFWDFGHPVSGMARERNTSGNTVTSGGSGFGVMSIIVGVERGFISRQEGIERLETIVDFLEQADRFHGVWPHWMNGETGETIPFSQKDDGGDLVETAFMMQGLLTARQYLNPDVPQETRLINKINALWEGVEWDWYTQGGQDVLYWHWSPNYDWEMNHKITGWNEALIIYVLAASSPKHTINASVYTNGWSGNGAMVNTDNNSYYGYTLPLRNDMGGPMFFSHYSFLGLDPRNLSDQFANYWEQNVTHSKINHAYCADNPQNYVSYSKDCWGLTASDGFSGYSAHSPNNDRGVLTPTAALSSLPYTPEESMQALHCFYYTLGDKLWGEYGFYDAFDLTNGWVADSYLAIDQGPIIIMIENYRTNLLWNLFMSCPEVQDGLTKLGFTY
jgi:hypothetical protein